MGNNDFGYGLLFVGFAIAIIGLLVWALKPADDAMRWVRNLECTYEGKKVEYKWEDGYHVRMNNSGAIVYSNDTPSRHVIVQYSNDVPCKMTYFEVPYWEKKRLEKGYK